ncbi:unnamed protein product [Prorocentrum cordatum]|uniref:Transmembrane protein n=1 Tax=Prorocentrum cordatum TaxID=2364126 RepID=A0ABN9WBE5_9DINO|nr:unnamed protein product [Polarella glacialis]
MFLPTSSDRWVREPPPGAAQSKSQRGRSRRFTGRLTGNGGSGVLSGRIRLRRTSRKHRLSQVRADFLGRRWAPVAAPPVPPLARSARQGGGPSADPRDPRGAPRISVHVRRGRSSRNVARRVQTLVGSLSDEGGGDTRGRSTIGVPLASRPWSPHPKATGPMPSPQPSAPVRMDDAEKLRARALVYQTMVSWAVGFTLAAQLSAAASASLPASPWEWKLFYALALLVLVVVLALVVFGIGICMGQDLRVLESISDVIVSGSAYTIALAFLDVVTAAFSLHSVSSTSDVDYLWEFYLVTCLVVALGTTVLGCLDYRGAREAAKELKQIEEAAQQGVVAIMKRSVVKHHLNANMRKLVSKTLSMCGVAVSFVLFHAWLLDWDTFDRNDGASSISSPFTFWGAMVFFLTCLFAAVVGSVLIEYNVNRMRKHLTKFDAMPSAVYDDWVMASLVVLLQTTSASLLEGMSWLVGTALHSWCLVGYTSIVRENDQADLLHKSAASLVFAMAVTMVTPLAMLRFAPPPLQGGSMQPHAK